MHIMVKKRYMQKFDTCGGREARVNKLLLKKPPGLMSASSTSLEEPVRAIKEKRGRREMQDRRMQEKCKKWTEEGDEHRVRR